MDDLIVTLCFSRSNKWPRKASFDAALPLWIVSMFLTAVDEDPLIVPVVLLSRKACIQQPGFPEALHKRSVYGSVPTTYLES